MVKVALWVQLEAKSGKEQEVVNFLNSALPLVEHEPTIVAWFALKIGTTIFGMLDQLATKDGSQGYIHGTSAAALMSKATDLLAKPPEIIKIDVLSAKLP